MRNKFNHILFFTVLFVWILVSSCQQSASDTPGSEYMPDMAHSIAYEANTYTYYYNNTWGTEDEYYRFAKPGEPVSGTVPRGAAGTAGASGEDDSSLDRLLSFDGELSHSGISIPANGSVPYNYADTEEDRMRAAEFSQNPFPINDADMASAKELYNVFCGICHGAKGDGAGYLVREDGGKYPAQPANLLLDQYVDMSDGQYYHAIMYGKNLMGSYSDKLSYEERWNVIHYIRTLQAKEKKLAYNENENTLNLSGIPGSTVTSLSDAFDKEMADRKTASMKMRASMDHHGSHGEHGHDDHGSHGENHGHEGEGHDDHSHDGDDHGHDGDDHGGHGHDGDDHEDQGGH